MTIAGKSVLVTGGTSGMGLACAQLLAKRGARVAITGRDREKGEGAAEEMRQAGADVCFICMDLASRGDATATVDEIVRRYGRLDVLVHAAAEPQPAAEFLEIDDAMFDRVMQVNLRGTFQVNQEAIRQMVPRGGGRIINFTSIAGALGRPHLASYSAAKAGIATMCKAIQKAHAKDNICVFVVAPGATDTPMWRANVSEAQRAKLLERTPFGKLPTVEQVAELVAFLADDATGYALAGQIFHVNAAEFMGY